MDKQQARRLLAGELEGWRKRRYVDLVALIDDEPATGEVLGGSGEWYQFEIQVFWDNKPGGDIRISGAIDDGGIRVYFPLSDSFIMASDGRFVGEDDEDLAAFDERSGKPNLRFEGVVLDLKRAGKL